VSFITCIEIFMPGAVSEASQLHMQSLSNRPNIQGGSKSKLYTLVDISTKKDHF